MKDFATVIIDMLEGKVDYGDVRVVQKMEEHIVVKNGKVESISSAEDLGFGVRVMINGFWGFASSNRLDILTAEQVVRRAIETAKAAAIAGGNPLSLAPEDPYIDSYSTPYQKDPFDIPITDKIELLMKVDELLAREKKVRLRVASTRAYRTYKVFASTEGSIIEQEIVECGAGYTAFAMDRGELQKRSYPGAFGGNVATAGWEFVEEMELEKHAPRVAEEAVKLLTAPPAPAGELDLVIGTNQMALQVHESIGHAVELDRVLGFEASYAGTSFATIDKLGNFRYGSPLMNVYADATTPRGLGTFGYDDEGVPAQRVPIVKEGILVGYLSSRDTAPAIGRRSSGAARASSWNRIPIVRMTNINLEPGDLSFEELIADVEDGLFIDTNKSWSIDQKRLNFQFGTEIGWRIKHGKLTEIVRDPVYTGITPQFWASLDGVGDSSTWELWGVPNCGKGEPGQSMHVGHGVPVARFRKVKVGSKGF